MMKKALAAVLCLCAVFAVIFSIGCGRDYLKMPDEPIEFVPYSFLSEDTQGLDAMMLNERPFVVYGTLKDSLKLDEVVEKVLGYRYNENVPDDRDDLVIKLVGTDDYLMVYYKDSFMQPPVFYRAMDTEGQDIFTPDYIESYGDSIWD